MPKFLTPHQREVFAYIADFQKVRGYTPSQQDLQRLFGYRSKNSITKTVNHLVEHGLIEKDPLGRIKFITGDPTEIVHELQRKIDSPKAR